jgi:PAS domain S-box-containing protein
MITVDPPMRTIPLLTSWGESEKLCVQDLLTLSTLSALWIDKDSEHIATEAAQVLAGMLELEFAAVQFSASSGAETFRHSAPKGDLNGLNATSFEALPQMNDRWPTSGVSDWQSSSDGPVMRIARIPIGLRNDGWLFAGSIDRQFPKDSEFVFLSTFAYQIAVALQNWLIKQTPQESDERFRQFAKYSADALWILDADTMQIEYLSPAFARIWGQAPATMLGEIDRWVDTVHPDDRIGTLAALASVLRGEVVVQQYRIVLSELVIRRIRHMLFPIRDDQGRVSRIGGVAADITKPADIQVYVLNPDDSSRDRSSRDRVSLLLQKSGYGVKAFASSRAFLEVAPVLVPGCLILDGRGSETKGLRIVSELKARRIDLPIIFIGNSRGDVGLVVKAMKAGATDWLEAPCKEAELLAAVASALAGVQDTMVSDRSSELARSHIAEMTGRERDVLLGLVVGETNKVIARRLRISPRTVEMHRAHVMERLGVRTLSEAVLLAASAGLGRNQTKSQAG